MGAARVKLWSFLFILVSIFSISPSEEADCEYTIYVQTGYVDSAGTDSVISVALFDEFGSKISINNLVTWGGQMGPNHDYFERGNLDIFSGRARCLAGPVCAVKVTSDNTGDKSGWYLDYVEVSSCDYMKVSSTRLQKDCTRQLFTIQQWLAVDEPPYSLTAIKNYCSSINKKCLNIEGSSGNKKYLNVDGSKSSNVAAM